LSGMLIGVVVTVITFGGALAAAAAAAADMPFGDTRGTITVAVVDVSAIGALLDDVVVADAAAA
jgi:hypothetical protein